MICADFTSSRECPLKGDLFAWPLMVWSYPARLRHKCSAYFYQIFPYEGGKNIQKCGIPTLQSAKNMVKYQTVPKKKTLGPLSGAIPAGLASGNAVEERERHHRQI